MQDCLGRSEGSLTEGIWPVRKYSEPFARRLGSTSLVIALQG
jgi:hypothetical protein